MSFSDKIRKLRWKVSHEDTVIREMNKIIEINEMSHFECSEFGEFFSYRFNKSERFYTRNEEAILPLTLDKDFFKDFEEKYKIDKGYTFYECQYFKNLKFKGECFRGAKYLRGISLPDTLTEIPSCLLMVDRDRTNPLTLVNQNGDKNIQLKWLNHHDLVLEIPGQSSVAPIKLIDNTDLWKKEYQFRYGAQRIIHLSQNISDSLRLDFLFDTKQHSSIFEVRYNDYALNLYVKRKHESGDFLSDFYDSLESFIKFSTYITRLFDKISNLWNLNALSFKPIMKNCDVGGILSDDDSKYFVIDCAIIYCTLLYLKPAGFTSDDIDFDKTFLCRYKDDKILSFFQPEKVNEFLKQIHDEVEDIL